MDRPRRAANSAAASVLIVAIADAFGSPLGYDRGRNRIEMVVQQQSSGLETDLDWVDVTGIGPLSGDAEPGQTAPLAVRHHGVGEDLIRHDDLGQARNLQG